MKCFQKSKRSKKEKNVTTAHEVTEQHVDQDIGHQDVGLAALYDHASCVLKPGQTTPATPSSGPAPHPKPAYRSGDNYHPNSVLRSGSPPLSLFELKSRGDKAERDASGRFRRTTSAREARRTEETPDVSGGDDRKEPIVDVTSNSGDTPTIPRSVQVQFGDLSVSELQRGNRIFATPKPHPQTMPSARDSLSLGDQSDLDSDDTDESLVDNQTHAYSTRRPAQASVAGVGGRTNRAERNVRVGGVKGVTTVYDKAINFANCKMCVYIEQMLKQGKYIFKVCGLVFVSVTMNI